MFEFKETPLITGIEKRASKTGREYTLAYFLGENGQTFGVTVDCELPEGIKQLDWVEVKFKLNVGRYTNIRITSMKRVEQ